MLRRNPNVMQTELGETVSTKETGTTGSQN